MAFYFRCVLVIYMNTRFVIVGVVLASLVTAAFFIGSPIFDGIDAFR